MGKSANVKQTIEAVDRHIKALELRKAGKSYGQIATELGYASSSGSQAAVLSGLKAVLKEPAEELRTLELSRIDDLWSVAFPMALSGDLRAVDSCLRISARRSALLGLDAPKNLDVSALVAVNPVDQLAAMSSEQLRAYLGQLTELSSKIVAGEFDSD